MSSAASRSPRHAPGPASCSRMSRERRPSGLSKLLLAEPVVPAPTLIAGEVCSSTVTPPRREVRHRNPNQSVRAHAAGCAIDGPITSDPQWRAVAVSRRGNRLDEAWASKRGFVRGRTLLRCLVCSRAGERRDVSHSPASPRASPSWARQVLRRLARQLQRHGVRRLLQPG